MRALKSQTWGFESSVVVAQVLFCLRSRPWVLVVRKVRPEGGQGGLPPITQLDPENARGTRPTELHDSKCQTTAGT